MGGSTAASSFLLGRKAVSLFFHQGSRSAHHVFQSATSFSKERSSFLLREEVFSDPPSIFFCERGHATFSGKKKTWPPFLTDRPERPTAPPSPHFLTRTPSSKTPASFPGRKTVLPFPHFHGRGRRFSPPFSKRSRRIRVLIARVCCRFLLSLQI